MSRLLSVSMTERGVVERRKRVTRRLGWWEDKRGRRLVLPGHELTLCRKVMGRKPGEPLVRLAQVGVLDVRREPLDAITDADAVLEAVEGVTTAAEEHRAAEVAQLRRALVDVLGHVEAGTPAPGNQPVDARSPAWHLCRPGQCSHPEASVDDAHRVIDRGPRGLRRPDCAGRL